MYYKLANYLELCGYIGLPFAVYNYKTGKTSFFKKEMYELVISCDGCHDIDESSISGDKKILFDIAKEKGLISECNKGDKLADYQQYKKFNSCFKENVQWSITGDCNYRCKHCFMSAPNAKFGVPTLEQCLRMVDGIKECGIRSVGITGGEPLIREDFFEIIEALVKNDIYIASIYTNGALVTEELLDKLISLRSHPSFAISFDGIGWHDWLRGIEGAEEKAINAFKLLKEKGFRSSSAMCLHKKNVDSLRFSILKLAELGCSNLKVGAASPEGLWEEHPEEFLSADENYQVVLDYIPQYYEDGMPINIMMGGAFGYNHFSKEDQEKTGRNGEYYIAYDHTSPVDFEKCYSCGAMNDSVYLAPDGRLIPCMSMIDTVLANKYPNAFEMGFREALNDPRYLNDSRCKASACIDNDECRNCEYKYQCRAGCRAIALRDSQTIFTAIDYDACAYFKHGYYEKTKALCEKYWGKSDNTHE